MDILNQVVLGNTVEQWLIALGIFLGVLLIFYILKRFLLNYLARRIASMQSNLADLLPVISHSIKFPVIFVLSAYIAALSLDLSPSILVFLRTLTMMVVIIQIGILFSSLLDYAIERIMRQQREKDPARVTDLHPIAVFLKIILWFIIILVALDNIPGVEMATMIASLGIAGVAVALAVSTILGDLFCSLTIVLDKPFVVGDVISVETNVGTVEKIGLKTTRIRSATGEELIYSNSRLLNNFIRNLKRLERRRVAFTIGVRYETPSEKLALIPEIVKEIINQHENATCESAYFRGYGDYALLYDIAYVVELPDWTEHASILENINLRLHRRFEEEGIQFAYPAQRVMLENRVSS